MQAPAQRGNADEPLYAMREIGRHNVGLFAARDISKGDLIFTEAPFLNGYVDIMMSYMLRESPTGGRDKAIDDECRVIKQEIQLAVSSQNADEEQGQSRDTRTRLMDRLSEIFISERFRECSCAQKQRWMSLHDQHQLIPADCASPVGLFDLAGEQSRWNGTIGIAKSSRQSVRCFEVEVDDGAGHHETLMVGRENLKTPAGILRSNSFEDGGLFQVRCRINHSCRPNTLALLTADACIPGLVARHPEEIAVIATCDIREGEELTNSYFNFSPGDSTAKRREILSKNYGFECRCQVCLANETLQGHQKASSKSAPQLCGRGDREETTAVR